MAESGSGSSGSSSSLPLGGNGSDGTEALKLLSKGWTQFVRIDRKSMFENIMHTLGARVSPVFSVEEYDDGSCKVFINMDVSNLTTVNGERIDHSIVRSEACREQATAECSAVLMALNHLENNYKIRVDDYSSRVVKKLESCNTFDLFQEAFGALQSVLVQWDLAFGKFDNFSNKVQALEFDDHVRGPVTPIGKVYGILSDYFTNIHHELHEKKKEILSGIEEIELDRRHYERRLAKKGRLFVLNGPFQDVALSSKWILEFVLRYYGLVPAGYNNTIDPSGMVKSTVQFNFPYMDGFKYGGNIDLDAIGYTYVEAEEQAAFRALSFIEKHFITKVIDVNNYQRKKELKIQSTLVSMLAKTLELSDCLKMMFGQLINAIELKIGQFSVHPDHFFAGPLAPGQLCAFKFCSDGLKEVDKDAVNCYGACAPNFELLSKLSWKLLALQSNSIIE